MPHLHLFPNKICICLYIIEKIERNEVFRGQLCPDDNDSLRVAECFTTPWFRTTWYLASAAFVCVASTCGRRSRTAGWPRGASLTCVCPQPCSSEGPEGPSGFLERLCFEMKKGYKETMLQLILSPIHIFLSDNYQVRYNPSRVERADWEPQGC